jgi:hypothetical protein
METRPWGTYKVIEGGETFQAKIITVTPKQRLSYQTHEKRAEYWVVVRGSGIATLEGKDVVLNYGDAIIIEAGEAHRISNPSDEDLVFIEVQTGTYFGEDDIVRLEDDYGRQ